MFTTWISTCVACVISLFSGPEAVPLEKGHLTASDLRCEYLRTPLAIVDPAPRLTWIADSDRRAEHATAYRILVSSSLERLGRNEGDLWDTGKVESASTTHIEYRGNPLVSRQVCYWKVQMWDRDASPGTWSEPERWEMGLQSPADWHAQWVEAGSSPLPVEIVRATYSTVDGKVSKDVTKAVADLVAKAQPVLAKNELLGGDPAYGVQKRLVVEYRTRGANLTLEVAENQAARFVEAGIPYLRKSFDVERKVAKARLYSTALGVYEMSLNGQRVGKDVLAPGWTDYRKRVRYQVYDVTGQLTQGENVFGALVGPGWFSGRAGLFHARAFYGNSPALLAQLEITYDDGTVDRIVTDGSWQRHDGPILFSDMMDGEKFDAAAAIEGWASPAFDASGWSPVTVRTETRTLEPDIDGPVRTLLELPAKAVTEPKPGRYTFDLAQNMVGVVRLRVNAPKGTVVTIRHAEMLNPDGTIYTENLRGAAATDTYICRGGGVEEWQPKFTIHGFRYVEVTGLNERPSLDAVTGIVLGSDLPIAGTFSSSNKSLDQLQSNIVWGLRGNYVSIPTDCPQRDERMGWMADTQVFAPTAAFNADVAAFMTKWMADVRDSQRADGAHSDVAPVMKGLTYGTPAWADAGTIVPWTMYEMYGDLRLLEQNIDSMIRWVDWCKANSNGLIRDHARGNDYGDWLSIGADTPKDLIGTAYFARSTEIVAKSLRALGRSAEADEYQKLFEQIKAAFNEKYVQADGRMTGDTQCAYAIALRFGLLPPEGRGRALELLVADIKAKDWHLSTGFVGVGNLLPVLGQGGQDDVAYRVLMQDTFPSWLFSVKHGATTIWERWNGWTPEGGVHADASMNSFNHYSLGSCGEWLYQGVGGIELDPEHPGFSKFIIRPRVLGPLTNAKTSYRSIRGQIATDWAVDGERLSLKVTVPANTSATVYVPAKEGTEVLEGGNKLDAAEGVSVLRRENGCVVLSVGSGTYEFSATRPEIAAGNPVFPGWYADPEIRRFDGRYWIYPTTSAKYDEQLHFDAFSSTDLATWTKHPNVLVSKAVPWARRAMWAPSVIEKDGKYYFFFGANDIQSDAETGGIGVAVSESPSGPFVDLLGKPLIDAFHNKAQPIDQFVFRDTDGTFYIFYGGWRHCNVAKLKPDFTGFEPFADGTTFKEVTPDKYVEGPFMFVRNGIYYFMWSEGGWTGPDYSVAYAMADSPLGPFRRIGKVLQQDPAIATGAGHHSVLTLPGDAGHVIVYHRRPLGETDGNHRVVCIDRMEFETDGRIKPVKITFEGVAAAPR